MTLFRRLQITGKVRDQIISSSITAPKGMSHAQIQTRIRAAVKAFGRIQFVVTPFGGPDYIKEYGNEH